MGLTNALLSSNNNKHCKSNIISNGEKTFSTSTPSSSHLCLITGFVTRVAPRGHLVE